VTPTVVTGGNIAVVTPTGPDSGSYQIDSGPVVNFSGITSFTWIGGAGTDAMTIDNAGGTLSVPITYTGSVGGANTLAVEGGSYASGVNTATGAGAGTLQYSGGASGNSGLITYSNLTPVSDTTAETNYTINTFGSPDTINVVNGPVVNGFQTDEVNSSPDDTFELIDFANKTNVTVTGTDNDTATVDYTTAAAGLATLTLDAAPTVNVLATPAAAATTVNSPGNNSTVTIGDAGLLSGIQGPVTVLDTPAFTTLVIDDSADANPETASLTTTDVGSFTYGTLTGLGMGPSAFIDYSTLDPTFGSFAGTPSVTIDAGTGADTILVDQTAPAATLTANTTTIDTGTGADTINVRATSANESYVITAAAGAGADTVNVGSLAPTTSGGTLADINGSIQVNNAAGTTALTIDDSGDGTSESATLGDTTVGATTYGQLTGLGDPAAITFALAPVNALSTLAIEAGSAGSIAVTGDISIPGAISLTAVDVSSTAAGTITTGSLTVNNSGSSSTLAGDIGGGTVTKTGTGTLVLSGSNTYTGSTTVSAGTLLVNGDDAAATGALAVNDTATLGGTGTIGGAVTVNSGGFISPGTVGTVGTLTVGSLAFDGGTYLADFSGNSSDTLDTAGAVNLANPSRGGFVVNSQTGTATPLNVYTPIDNTGAAILNPPLSGAPAGGFVAIDGMQTVVSYVGGTGNSFTLTVSQAPAVTSASDATFTVGTTGTFTVTSTGSPTAALSETGALPGGVTFVDNGNGTATLSGRPDAGTGGVYEFTITADNGVGSAADQSFALTVDQAPAITSSGSTTFAVGTTGAFTVTATGFPASSLSETGALPGGVTFVDNGNGTATLSGIPAAGTGGTYNFTVTAANGVGPAANRSFTLTVDQATAITSANQTTFVVLSAGSFTVTATGFPTPDTFSETGALPAGVTFNATTGVLSGTPTTFGAFPITITAGNGVVPDAAQNFTLTVSGIPAYATTVNEGFVAQVYLDLLGRYVDQGGLATWSNLLNQGESRAQVVLQIEQCDTNEYRAIEVEDVYERILNRQADPSGLQSGVAFLVNGGTVQQLTAILLGSPEFYQNEGGGTYLGFVQALYQAGLQRPVDPSGEASVLQELRAGVSDRQVALFVTTSAEAERDLVETAYQAFLLRPADPAALAADVQFLENGGTYEQLVAGIIGSNEYLQTRDQI
jgi:autotransporter-associated beta strand protein